MEFQYQAYVKKMVYSPYAWPPDISLAGLHSRCSEPGKQNPVGVSCPCCGHTIKLKMDGWIKRDIYEDFQSTGAGIPIYFGLLRFYNAVVLLLFLVNAPYFTYAITKACGYQKDQCVHIGFLYYLDFSTMIKIFELHRQFAIIDALTILQTVVFYILLVANNLSIFYLVYLAKKCKTEKKSTKRFMSLLVQNIPIGTSQQQLRKMIILSDGSNPKITNVTFIKMLNNFDELWRKRVKAFYQLKALYIECIDPKKQLQKNRQLKLLQQQYIISGADVKSLPSVKAIIMFQNYQELVQVHQKYHYKQFSHWIQRISNKISKSNKVTDIFVNFLPELDQTIWVNMGQDHKFRLLAKIITMAYTICMLIFCYCLFYYPLLFTLGVHSTQHKQAKMTIAEKFLPTIVALGLVGMSIFFRSKMQQVGKRRYPRAYYEQSQFVLTTTIMFHLIFYLIVPTIFFRLQNGLDGSVKLFAISSQARTFIFIQLILSFLDSIFRFWRINKMQTLADQRQAFKYPQKYLHQRVQYREYPIQIKLIVMFKIWSLVLFYSFFVPVIMLYIVVAMIALYFLQKRNIYLHYAVRRNLSANLEIRFLNLYINFFCLYQCFIYIVNVTSTWQQITAVASTIVSLLLQWVYWNILKKRELKKQRYKIRKAKNDIRRSLSSEKDIRDLNQQLIQSQKQFDSQEQQDDDDPTYGAVYQKFLQQYNQAQLDKEIQEYLLTIYDFNCSELEEHESQKTFTQPMAKSRSPTVIEMS